MATVKSLVDVIAAAHFMANADQVQRLAHQVVDGNHADGTYLKVLLAHLLARLGKPATRRARRAGDGQSALEALEVVNKDLYTAVLKGVGPDDLDINERNRRATFARSAASTLRYFIEKGGDVRTVDIATVTKGGLRKAVAPAASAAPEGETRTERAFRKAQDALVRSAQRLLARGDPEQARTRIEAAMDALEALLGELPEEPAQPAAQDFGGQTTTIVAGRPGTRGAPAERPMFHRGP